MKKTLYSRIRGIVKVCALLYTFISVASSSLAQGVWKDTTINCKMFIPEFSGQLPASSMASEFSWDLALGGSFYFKMNHNILLGVDGNYFFGTDVKDPLFRYISNSSGGILGDGGIYSSVALYERGYNFTARIGKVFPMFGSNKNSGLFILGGAGFLQHKIRILVIDNDIPELTGDYLKGYDHLTNGPCLTQSIGYQHLGRHNLGNFNISLEGFEGFTKNRRVYNFDTMGPDNSLHLDILIFVKVGFILPFYTDVSKMVYTY
jgi:hypothetical protein